MTAPRAPARSSDRAAERPGWLGRALEAIGHEPITPFRASALTISFYRYRHRHMAPEARITAVETRQLPLPARPAVPGCVGSRPAHASGRHARARPLGRGRHGLRERRPPARPRGAGAVPRGPRPAAHGGSARDLRDGRLPRRPAVDCRVRDLGSRGPAAGHPRVAPARRSQRAPDGVCLERRAGRAGRARTARGRAARSRRARAQAALPPRGLARGHCRRRACARCGRRRLRADGRRQPGLAHGGRPRAALGRRHGGALRA